MKRIPEPELMEDPIQAEAYARADFEEPHSRFVELFKETFSGPFEGTVLDLGCGPGDVVIRFARAFPSAQIDAVDASRPMLEWARKAITAAELDCRIRLIHGYLPNAGLPRPSYDAIISNSLLHHLQSPNALWSTIGQSAVAGTKIFVMDLMRPDTRELAEQFVETYSGNEPPILKRDFFNSLLAAYRPEEIQAQLTAAGLNQLDIRTVSDRHLVVCGRIHG
jgi:cyclopropane fatty-acyl-phospholipid synthase-like methyltransferase